MIAPGGNALAIFASALLFALQYTMSFSSSRSFGEGPYGFDPLKIGFVLLSFGGGNMVGSITVSHRFFLKADESLTTEIK